MSSIVLIFVVAGIVVGAALLIALIAWSVRIRREESDFVPAPEWLKKGKAAGLGMPAPVEEPPSVIEVESPLSSVLRKVAPELSSAIDFRKLVEIAEATRGRLESSEDRKTVIKKVVYEMLEQQPENEFLRQVLDSLHIEGDTADLQDRIKVVQIPGRTLIHVDGVEYSSVTEIPDPEMRDAVRRILDTSEEEDK